MKKILFLAFSLVLAQSTLTAKTCYNYAANPDGTGRLLGTNDISWYQICGCDHARAADFNRFSQCQLSCTSNPAHPDCGSPTVRSVNL